MIFKKITMENFKSVGPEPITIDLGFNGTKLLLGKNGAGKTTVFDAIIWCVYGVSKLKADNVVNKNIKSGAKVEVEFSEGDRNYVITRYRKHPVHKNNTYVFENGNNITLKNQGDTQDLIQKIVGVDSRAFMSSISLSSETYKQFLRETNATRLQIFESVFSLRELNDLSKINKQKIRDIEKQFNDKNSDIVSIKSYIEADTNALKNYKENYNKQINDYDSQIEQLKNGIDTLENQLREINTIDFDREYELAIKKEESNLKTLENQNKKKRAGELESQISSLNNKVESYKKFLSEHPASLLKEQAEINKVYESAINRISEINALIKTAEYNKKKVEYDIMSYNKAKDIYIKELSKINNELEKLLNNVCPTCGQVISSGELEQIKSNFERDKNKLESNIEEINSRLRKSDEELEKYITDINLLNNESASLNVEKPIYNMAEIKVFVGEIKRMTDELQPIKEEIDSKKEELAKLKLEIDDTIDVLNSESKYTVDSLNKLKENISSIKTKIELLNGKINIVEELKTNLFDKKYVSSLMNSIKERQEIVDKLSSEIIQIRKDYAEYQVLDEVFSNGPNGFKKYFIENVISLFNNKINTFLPFFFDESIEINFDKNLNDKIVFRGEETEFDELSSGEKTRCEMCVIFSLFFMVRNLFGCGTNLLAIDEILDRGLDEQGIKASKQILDDISSDTAVFVVTHRDDLKEMFKDVMVVYKDGDGFTKIK